MLPPTVKAIVNTRAKVTSAKAALCEKTARKTGSIPNLYPSYLAGVSGTSGRCSAFAGGQSNPHPTLTDV